MLGQKLGRQVKSLKHLLYTIKGTVLIQSSLNYVRLLIIIMSRSSFNFGHVGSKTRSLGQILERPTVHYRVHSFDSKLTKLYQNVNDHNI